MDQQEVPLATDTAEQDISGNELLINVYPRRTTGGKYSFNLIGSPGLAFNNDIETTSVEMLYSLNGKRYAISKTAWFEIYDNVTYKKLGDVSINGRISIADNGNQIVIVDGFKGFYLDVTTEEVKEITAEGFYPANTVSYQDGYFLFDRKGTGQWFISQLLSVDFDPLDFITAEGQPDNTVGLISDHREVFVFGEKSIQVFYNSGDADFPFEVNQGAFVEKGCPAPYSIAKQNNTVYFIGSDDIVYQISGYNPVRISNHAVEKTLKGADYTGTFSMIYNSDGHLFYIITVPSRNITWCYDISTGSWHVRQDYHFGRHRANCLVVHKSKTYVGDFQSGRIYQWADNYYTDDNEPLLREIVLPTINLGRDFISLDSFELDMETGVGLIDGQGSDPMARMEFSVDSGKTWSNEKFAFIGKLGEYWRRVKWNRLGNGRQFIIRIMISDPVKIDIGGAFIEGGK